MKITNLKNIPAEKVEMDGVKDCQYQVAITSRDGPPSMAMRFFDVAPGGNTPLHNHPYEHEIYVTEGMGTVWREGQEVPLKAGDILYIPSDEKHQFKNVSDKPFKFMCLIPAKFQKCWMARLTKIYTRTGDKGDTGLVGGKRVSKDSPRLWAYGTVDELNSAIGVARSFKPDKKTDAALAGIQNDLFNLGAELATQGKPFVCVEQVRIDALEKLMDTRNSTLGPLREFILPGGTPVAAQLHVARTICRRAERFCVRLRREEKIGVLVVPYLNRLSDALFVLARWVNYKAGKVDTFWTKR